MDGMFINNLMNKYGFAVKKQFCLKWKKKARLNQTEVPIWAMHVQK